MASRPARSSLSDRQQLLRLGLTGSALFFAVLTAVLIFVFALRDADDRLVAALEGKATAHAREIKQDVEIALGLGVALAEIRGAYEYLEEGANLDPDVRFAVLTDRELRRIHYGGIGRRRLDPLLATPELEAELQASLAIAPDSSVGITNRGFSLSALPLEARDQTAGYVIVAVQAKQVREALLTDFVDALPAALAVLLLLIEIALSVVRSAVEEPLARLRRLMIEFAVEPRLERSGRHDRSELGIALVRFNGIAFRLAERARRVQSLAGEVGRAVFDAEIASKVERRAQALKDDVPAALYERPSVRLLGRPSDLQLSVTLLICASTLGLGVLLAGAATPLGGVWGLLGLAVGALLGLRLLATGWALGLAGAGSLLGAALMALQTGSSPATSLASALLAGTLGCAVALGYAYLKRTRFAPLPWTLTRLCFGLSSGTLFAMTLHLESRDTVAAPLIALLGIAALLLAYLAGAARRRLFARAAHGS